jgi:hypothetical protein
MWDEYRIGKSIPNQFIMMAVVPLYNRPNKKFSPEYWLGETREYEPPPGSTYWIETFLPPMWFVDMLGDADVSGCIDALRADKERPKTWMKGHTRKKRRRARQDQGEDTTSSMAPMTPAEFKTSCMAWLEGQGYETAEIRATDGSVEILASSSFDDDGLVEVWMDEKSCGKSVIQAFQGKLVKRNLQKGWFFSKGFTEGARKAAHGEVEDIVLIGEADISG